MALIPLLGGKSPDRHARRDGSSRPEGIRLIPVESASATARPDAIAETYLEREHDAHGLEQQHLFAAEGEVQARDQAAAAKAADYAATQMKSSVERARSAADNAAKRSERIRDVLGPYVRRKAMSWIGYVLRLLALLIGDIAGLAGAAIALGEAPALAITQAISAGTATVTAGLAATELRHRQHAAERKLDEIPEALEPYRHLFGGATGSNRLRAAVLVIAATIALFVSVGVFALRTAIEGELSGLTFGALAAAIAMASFVNSWYHADAVADVVESAQHDAHRADRRHRRLSKTALIGKAETAAFHGGSLITEYTHRGLAAAAHLEAEKYRALQASPDVVGHGPAPDWAPRVPATPRRRGRSA
ncbi:hypothetical protein [Mycobacteroides abscessus]|uniref:hypothetical protein n=1 Tax=Mycobacteroides abscessus TaxID=36809 RepID=UPI0009A8848E|nr:hypothetical protein [Mycobacteroides abscessus]SLC89113.1 Uncharacterised protein [Mycobacteroides abscessus subsp. massiliense]